VTSATRRELFSLKTFLRFGAGMFGTLATTFGEKRHTRLVYDCHALHSSMDLTVGDHISNTWIVAKVFEPAR
jgi:hypothetical protein